MGSEATPAPAQPAAAAPAAPEAPATEASGAVDFQARAAALIKDAPSDAQLKEAAAPGAKPAEGKAPLVPVDPAKPAAAPVDEVFAGKFAQFADQQKRERAEREAHKAAIREEREALRREQAELDTIRQAKGAASPVKALVALGWSYEDATAEMLGKPVPGRKEPEAAPKVDPELQTLKQELAAMKAERQAEQDRAAVASFKASMVAHAQAAPEKYELVDATDSYDEAVKLVTDYVNTHKELPAESAEASMEMALAHVEAKLEKRLLSERVLTANKVRQRLTSAAPKPAVADRPQATSAKSPPSALTNSLAAAAPSRAAKPEPRNREEFIAAAAALLREGAD